MLLFTIYSAKWCRPCSIHVPQFESKLLQIKAEYEGQFPDGHEIHIVKVTNQDSKDRTGVVTSPTGMALKSKKAPLPQYVAGFPTIEVTISDEEGKSAAPYDRGYLFHPERFTSGKVNIAQIIDNVEMIAQKRMELGEAFSSAIQRMDAAYVERFDERRKKGPDTSPDEMPMTPHDMQPTPEADPQDLPSGRSLPPMEDKNEAEGVNAGSGDVSRPGEGGESLKVGYDEGAEDLEGPQDDGTQEEE